MQISEVRVYLRNEQKLKAFVTVTFDSALVVHNMKIVEGQKGLILCMPSRKGPDEKFRDVVHPINNEFRHSLEGKVFEAYRAEVQKLSASINNNNNNNNDAAGVAKVASEPTDKIPPASDVVPL